ncbi:hypothetical protein Trydic_g18919 [Trypoxylus dichotomus]
MKSETFSTIDGLRQRGRISLLIIFMDAIVRECNVELEIYIHVGYWCSHQVNISECAFADVVVLLAKSEKDLQKNIIVWKEILMEHGIKHQQNKNNRDRGKSTTIECST